VEGIARVLCAVDIGEPGLAAFEQALALARVHAAKLIVVYAVPRSQSFSSGATERVAYLLNLRAAAEAAGVDVRVDVQRGEAAGIILLHARARQPDLIVLSAAHGNGANGLRVGAVVEDVLRGAICPTLVVGRHHELSRNVRSAVDFSPSSDAAVERALSLVAERESRLTLLHVVYGPEEGSGWRSMRMHADGYYRHVAGEALHRLQSLIPLSGEGTVLARVVVGRVAPEIVRTARASEADLVIVGTQSRSRLGCWMFGVTGQLLQDAPCPVLAVPTRTPHVRERNEWRPAA
jgi:universal stress protein A